MFSEITKEMKKRMLYLEQIDKKDRTDGTERIKRLRQIPPETGRFLAVMASNCPQGEFIEIGTSAGYSTMWIYLAAREKNIKIKTYELLDEKIKLAKETFESVKISGDIELIHADAFDKINELKNISFCFIDTEKELYEKLWDKLSDKIIRNGILIADNAIDHYDSVKPMLEKALNDERFDSLIVPIGKGVLVCRRK